MTFMRTGFAMIVLLSFSLSSYSATLAKGHSLGHEHSVEEVAAGLGTIWGMDFLSDQQLLITERSGSLRLLNLDSGNITDIAGLPEVHSAGQGGLLDVKASPDYNNTRRIYLTYSKPDGKEGATTLARAKLEGKKLIQWQDLLVTKAGNSTTRHYGSRITFDNAGHLFFTIGDRGHRPNGQDLSTHASTVVRLTLDGQVPADNPYVDDPTALDEIWSYGHRNPQGISFDHATGKLWLVEHGPRGGDEVNLIQPAQNYGWPVVSQGKEYWAPLNVGSTKNQPGMTEPVKVYIPSIAPSSLLVYRGSAFPAWQGTLFIGALAQRHLNVVTLDSAGLATAEQRLLSDLNERIRSITTDSKGIIYLSTDSGRILRIRPAASG